MTTWTTGTSSPTSWINAESGYRDKWGDWAAITWGAIQSSGGSWRFMSGDTFVDVSTQSTTWTTTTG